MDHKWPSQGPNSPVLLLVATSIEKALAVKKALEIQWDESVPAAQHTSQEAYDEFSALLDPKKEKGRVLTDQGDIKQAFAKAFDFALRHSSWRFQECAIPDLLL